MQVNVPPRISPEGFAIILRALGSPAAPVATACYQAIALYGLDPAVGLAFFKHESGAGKNGAARYSHNWGNIRAGGKWLSHHDGTDGTWLVYRARAGEQPVDHWVRSAADWAQLIKELYVARWGLASVEAALQRYAPKEDQNDPDSYAQCVIRDVESWARLYPVEEEEEEYVTRAEFDKLAGRVAWLEERAPMTPKGEGVSTTGIAWPEGVPT